MHCLTRPGIGHRQRRVRIAGERGSLDTSSHLCGRLLIRTTIHTGDINHKRACCRAQSGEQPPSATLDEDASDRPPSFFSSVNKSLQDFGIGARAWSEGGSGLFLLVGAGAILSLVAWAKGTAMRKEKPYLATVEFPQACGITVGTPVRIRGVQVGSVLNVRPSLDRVDVLVEVNDVKTVIPRNSLVEANQSGLIAEPLVDITPQLPIPVYKARPLDADCEREGNVVCHQGHIKGQQGVSFDDLVLIMTRLARQMDQEGIGKIFETAEQAKDTMKVVSLLLEEVNPLLAELRQSGLVSNVDSLLRTASEAAAEVRELQSALLTEENVKALRQSVLTLCRTLEHVESLTGDMSSLSRDNAFQRNIKTLTQALSRLVEE